MAILDQYSRYLEHFGTTVPVRELHTDTQTRGLCALRHDVDYDLDVALEMAYWEHEVGARATYYLLPIAAYWSDERLADKCLQLQDYGHEVGLHVNAMAQWIGGETDDPERTLMDQLDTLRQAGVTVTGIAAHGDRRCYEYNISNYWCFRELRPKDPVANEDGRTAEGPYDHDHPGRRLHYPSDHFAKRPDGMRYPLWSISMGKLAVDYDAWHTAFDRYFSDSGGNWTRTPDPIAFARGDERWQVLMHPIHWRGPQRVYFFLSPARSGSKWLSEVLHQATPLEARHEYILNQEYHSGIAAQKATATAGMLERESARVEKLLGMAWEETHEIPRDYAEVNVYLPAFVHELQRYFPAATFVHLRRNPANVVRSLMQRDWYDTPEDHAHPRLHSDDIATMTRFERVCEYVSDVNERLMEFCGHKVSLETLASTPESLKKELHGLGIPYHKRLGGHLFGQAINASKHLDFPDPAQWTTEQKRKYTKRMAGIDIRMGYAGRTPRPSLGLECLCTLIREQARTMLRKAGLLARNRRGELPDLRVDAKRMHGENCDIRIVDGQIIVTSHDESRHAYITIGGSRWHRGVKLGDDASGWPVKDFTYIKGIVERTNPQDGSLTVWALTYGRDGKQIYRRRLGALDRTRERLEFAFAPHPSGDRFDVAMHIPKADAPTEITICNLELQYKKDPDENTARKSALSGSHHTI